MTFNIFPHSFRLPALTSVLFLLFFLSIPSLISAAGACDNCGQTVTLIAPCLNFSGSADYQNKELTANTKFIDPQLANCQCTQSYLTAYQSCLDCFTSKGLSTSNILSVGNIQSDCDQLGISNAGGNANNNSPGGSGGSGGSSPTKSAAGLRLNDPSMIYTTLMSTVIIIGILSQRLI
ncbi:1919_t:CDS:2 [Paraglomus occultum]|uniref:1919_t:CDS:1 n=1 Tax=Paraglomus occultum TaxID=144539 RepID=A0A9N9D3K0_9GLOM|nr:1919_t:CDS:2 [Paraglomus occultum]